MKQVTIDNLELLLYPFDIPEGCTISLCKEGLPMSDYCKQYLTDKNFGTKLPKDPVAGGFYDMKARFESYDGINAIQKFATQTGRKLRVGTALELLLFWMQKRVHCPKCFVALGSVWDGKVLYWYGDCAEFRLDHWVGKWNEFYQVFFVEDLEPPSTPS